jgi:threonine dehydratase
LQISQSTIHNQDDEGDCVTPSLDKDAIARTYELIRPFIRRTPVLDWADSGFAPGALTLKLELLQHAGSFKARGAFANLLTRDIPAAGVCAASGGNHGAAVAYAAMRRGVKAHIFVPAISSPAKIARIRDFGAELVIGGDSYADALAASEDWRRGTDALGVHAFDQTETMLGQGTLALEFEEQAPALDTILVAVGGGGLIAGIAAWCAGRIRVIGVEPEASPTLAHALKAGRPVDAPVGGLAADSLAPRRVGAQVFPVAQAHVERVVLVSDPDISAAQRMLWERGRIAAEPGGATAFAALLCGRYVPRLGERVGVVISGGNTNAVNFS